MLRVTVRRWTREHQDHDHCGDPLGRAFEDSREQVHKHLEARNHSILAHGLNPLGREDAGQLGDWENWLAGLMDRAAAV